MAGFTVGLYDVAVAEDPLADYVNSDPEKPLSSLMSPTERVAEHPFRSDTLKRRVADRAITLQEFCSDYASQLPQRIRVIKGVYGENEESTISCEDQYNVHFTVHRELVRMEDTKTSESFSVPLKSSIEFGLLYNPNRDEREALRGFVFTRATDILNMGLDKRPPLVCSMRSCSSNTTKVQEGEVLLVKGAYTTDSGRILTFYSFTDHKEKCVHESIAGHFTTRPYHVRLFLKDILEHVPNVIPATAVAFPDQLTALGRKLPNNQVLRITQKFTDVLLIATNGSQDSCIEDAEPFEIPADLEIEIVSLDIPEKERLQLEVDTEYLKEQLGYKTVKHYRYVTMTDSAYQTQSDFLDHDQCISSSDQEGDGERGPFEVVSGWPKGRAASRIRASNRRSRLGLKKKLDALENTTKQVEANVSTIKSELASLVARVNPVLEERAEADARATKEDRQLQVALLQIKQLQEEVLQLRERVTGSTEAPLPPVIPNLGLSFGSNTLSLQDRERNRARLASLNQKQVILLLQAMGLGQYEKTFSHEDIAGDILLELDGDILQEELGVASRIHCIKVLKLISGLHSVDMYFQNRTKL